MEEQIALYMLNQEDSLLQLLGAMILTERERQRVIEGCAQGAQGYMMMGASWREDEAESGYDYVQ